MNYKYEKTRPALSGCVSCVHFNVCKEYHPECVKYGIFRNNCKHFLMNVDVEQYNSVHGILAILVGWMERHYPHDHSIVVDSIGANLYSGRSTLYVKSMKRAGEEAHNVNQ